MAKYIFNKRELSVSFTKGSGPGGQNRNKRETAVRVLHKPTGLIAEASERRSQNQNLQAALERLERKIEKYYFKPEPRYATSPTRASVARRSKQKLSASRKKSHRKKNFEWDE